MSTVAVSSTMPTEQYSTLEEQVQVSTDSEFIESQMRRVFRLIYRVVGNVPDAQDLAQEAFVKQSFSEYFDTNGSCKSLRITYRSCDKLLVMKVNVAQT